ALIEAGVEILEEEGNNALSLRKVARKVGVSHAAPYRHFENKELLIAAIADEGYAKLEEKMNSVTTEFSDDSSVQIIELGWAYIHFAIENPNHLRVMFTDFSESCTLETGDSFALLVNSIIAGQEANDVVAGDTVQLALALWATVHGLSTLLIENKIPAVNSGTVSAEEVARASLLTIFNGLRKKIT
ncbi:MAG: TetR/AcrR family transcriptional regulator, partial [Anaerolineae bacterium]|nr:TetR/AcrR family transcriptional regulator [Anaerolineae bacterium]